MERRLSLTLLFQGEKVRAIQKVLFLAGSHSLIDLTDFGGKQLTKLLKILCFALTSDINVVVSFYLMCFYSKMVDAERLSDATSSWIRWRRA